MESPISDSFLYLNCFAIVLLMLVFFHSRRFWKKDGTILILRLMIPFAILMLLSDIVLYLLNGKPDSGSRLANNIAMVCYFSNTGLLSFAWGRFMYANCSKNRAMPRKVVMITLLPLLVLVGMSVLSPWTQWYFYFDESGFYHRGSLHFVQAIIGYGAIISAALFVLVKMRTTVLQAKRSLYRQLFFYTLLPFVGGMFQIISADYNLIAPCIALSTVMYYISRLGYTSSLDSLTKLQNRSRLDAYLDQRMRSPSNIPLFLVFMDVDYFKRVNDTYGHLVGDTALIMVASSLQSVFASSNAVISRFGGDEFALAIECSRHRLDRLLAEFNAVIAERSRKELPFDMHLSIGYASTQNDGVHSCRDLIRAADDSMYEAKQHRPPMVQRQEAQSQPAPGAAEA